MSECISGNQIGASTPLPLSMRRILLVLALFAGACSEATIEPGDGGLGPRVDAGVDRDAAPPRDSGPRIDAGTSMQGIVIEGRRVLVDGAPLELRGVCWSPVARGERLPPDYARFVGTDAPLMQAAGIDTVRTYGPIRDRAVLDTLHAHGIRVLMTVYAWGGDPERAATDAVREVADHPAILMWIVGNEWNYNGLYTGVPFDEARDRLERIAASIRALDPSRPIATVYGELPTVETIAAMPSIDIWGLNVYRGITFGDLFDRWAERSDKPMFLAEYGADAWDARDGGRENLAAQAEATRALTLELLARSTARHDDGITLGGTIFEWADEWWKDESGSPGAHDVGGIAPGGGPHPDRTFNEEWWGIVDIDRMPRPAYEELARLFAP